MNEQEKKFRNKYLYEPSMAELSQQDKESNTEKEDQTVGSQIAQFLTGGTDNPKVENVVRKMLTKEDEDTIR